MVTAAVVSAVATTIIGIVIIVIKKKDDDRAVALSSMDYGSMQDSKLELATNMDDPAGV